MLLSGYTSTRITFTVLSFSPQMKLTQLFSFLSLPKNSTHKLKAVTCLLCLSPFLWFLFHSHFCLLLFPLLTLLSNTSPDTTLALLCLTSDDIWPILAAWLYPHSSLLPSQVSPSVTSHDNTSSLHASLLSFYFFSLTVCSMIVPFLTLLQTAKQFFPSSPSPNRDVLFLLPLPINPPAH